MYLILDFLILYFAYVDYCFVFYSNVENRE